MTQKKINKFDRKISKKKSFIDDLRNEIEKIESDIFEYHIEIEILEIKKKRAEVHMMDNK